MCECVHCVKLERERDKKKKGSQAPFKLQNTLCTLSGGKKKKQQQGEQKPARLLSLRFVGLPLLHILLYLYALFVTIHCVLKC